MYLPTFLACLRKKNLPYLSPRQNRSPTAFSRFKSPIRSLVIKINDNNVCVFITSPYRARFRRKLAFRGLFSLNGKCACASTTRGGSEECARAQKSTAHEADQSTKLTDLLCPTALASLDTYFNPKSTVFRCK